MSKPKFMLTSSIVTAVDSPEAFVEKYKQWQELEPMVKSNLLLAFTQLPTPKNWIETKKWNSRGELVEIPYIPVFRARKLLNLFFGFGNWSLEIQETFKDEETASVIGYLVISWFDGTVKKIPTAGRGKIHKGNPLTSSGDDLKSAISDAIKKGMANMGFFSDVYGEKIEPMTEETEEEKSPHPRYDYAKLKERVDQLVDDHVEGKATAARIDRAIGILTDAGFNDLLLTVKKLKDEKQATG